MIVRGSYPITARGPFFPPFILLIPEKRNGSVERALKSERNASVEAWNEQTGVEEDRGRRKGRSHGLYLTVTLPTMLPAIPLRLI